MSTRSGASARWPWIAGVILLVVAVGVMLFLRPPFSRWAGASLPVPASAPAPGAPATMPVRAAGWPTLAAAGADALTSEDVTRLLERHLGLAFAHGPDATARYEESLRQLRGTPGAIAGLKDAYDSTPTDDYGRRWALVQTMGAVGTADAVPVLAELATTDVPPGSEGEDGTQHQEHLIRMRAVEGLADIAHGGDAAAALALERSLQANDAAVRALAAYEYLRLAPGDPHRVAQVKAQLAPGDAWMADIRGGQKDTDGHVDPPTPAPVRDEPVPPPLP